MNDDIRVTIVGILILILVSGSWHIFGILVGNEQGRDKTVVLCVEKPEQCKERYEFLKLREKLGE